jgi:hypothetical protein
MFAVIYSNVNLKNTPGQQKPHCESFAYALFCLTIFLVGIN